MTPENAVMSICADARWSTKGQHADYCRCILSQAIATATATLQAENAALRKELDALHGPASRPFTPAEIIRIADELGLLSDDIRHQPTLGKIRAAVSRLSNKYGDVLAERDELQHRLDLAMTFVPRPQDMSGYNDPDAPEEVLLKIAQAQSLHSTAALQAAIGGQSLQAENARLREELAKFLPKPQRPEMES